MQSRLELELDDWLDPSVAGVAVDKYVPVEWESDHCVDDELCSNEPVKDVFPAPYFLCSRSRCVCVGEDGYIMSLTENGVDILNKKTPDLPWFIFEEKNNLMWPSAWERLCYKFNPFSGELVPRHIVPAHFEAAVLRHGCSTDSSR